jgi:hypothetical protein
LAADVSLEHAAAEIDTMRAAKIATTERITLGDSTEVEGVAAFAVWNTGARRTAVYGPYISLWLFDFLFSIA